MAAHGRHLRCAVGDQAACAELVATHQRMVFTLALNLLGDRDEAMDLSQEVFLRVFRTLSGFRGQSALRTWIYRIVVNQARNRQRWWRRRHVSQQVSLDEHIAEHGEVIGTESGSPDRVQHIELSGSYTHGLGLTSPGPMSRRWWMTRSFAPRRRRFAIALARFVPT